MQGGGRSGGGRSGGGPAGGAAGRRRGGRGGGGRTGWQVGRTGNDNIFLTKNSPEPDQARESFNSKMFASSCLATSCPAVGSLVGLSPRLLAPPVRSPAPPAGTPLRLSGCRIAGLGSPAQWAVWAARSDLFACDGND